MNHNKSEIRMQLTYSEIFYSIQGEGSLMGVPSVFVRTSGCNLRCWFCDTPYTSFDPEVKQMTIEDVVRKVKQFNMSHVVITGGEPYIQENALILLCKYLKEEEMHITIETNGTIYFPTSADLISISPKLRDSHPLLHQIETNKWLDRHEARRINPEAIKKFRTLHNYQFKFVATEEFSTNGALAEIKTLQAQYLIPNNKIYLMPEGTTRTELAQTQQMVAQVCMANNWNYSDRLHIRLWDNERGV